MKINVKSLVIFGGVGLCIFLSTQCILSLSPPSNESLIQNLKKNEVQYSTILEMLSVDTNVGTIASSYLLPKARPFIQRTFDMDSTASDLNITDERLIEYRKIMNTIGIDLLARHLEGEVTFGHKGPSRKGILWFSDPSTATNEISYPLIKIKDGWYIYHY